MLKYNNYDVLIFDLGNTILPINPKLTVMAFQNLGFEGDILTPDIQLQEILLNYQKGQLSTDEFLHIISGYLSDSIRTEDIVKAWNMMLLEYPVENIELLKNLQKHHALILLSNTNELHMNCFEAKAKEANFKMENVFNQVYYSHKVRMSKPDKEIYDFVHEKNKLNDKKVLFLDDINENLIYPKELNWDVYQISAKQTIFDLV